MGNLYESSADRRDVAKAMELIGHLLSDVARHGILFETLASTDHEGDRKKPYINDVDMAEAPVRAPLGANYHLAKQAHLAARKQRVDEITASSPYILRH